LLSSQLVFCCCNIVSIDYEISVVRKRAFSLKSTKIYKRLKEKKKIYKRTYIHKLATSIIYASLNVRKRFDTFVLLLYTKNLKLKYIFCRLCVIECMQKIRYNWVTSIRKRLYNKLYCFCYLRVIKCAQEMRSSCYI